LVNVQPPELFTRLSVYFRLPAYVTEAVIESPGDTGYELALR